MKIDKQYEIVFDNDETILSATLSKNNEVVVLMNSGNVIRYDIDQQKSEQLFSIKNVDSNSTEGFDLTAESSIYTLDKIVVVSNDFKTHAYVHYPSKFNSLCLEREDYYASHSRYPIALYKNEIGIPHLIYAVAWNHIQIMNLDTKQILTASKSLETEIAEGKIRELLIEMGMLEKFQSSPYDYFFGELKLSPDKNYFLSKGWSWGSSDSYTIYNIEHFVNNTKILPLDIGSWEHLNRSACWINEQTVAFGYNPFAEDDNGVNYSIGSEIQFCNFTDSDSEDKVVKVEGLNTISVKMEYSDTINALILFSEEIGVTIVSLDGQILLQDNDLKVKGYFPHSNQFITILDKAILVHKLTD